MSFIELKTKAENFRKNHQYSEALPIFEELWQQYREQCNEWIGWGYAKCLYEFERYSEALDICRETWKLKRDFEQNNNLSGWCIYHLEIKNAESMDELLVAANKILKLTQHTKFSPYEKTVFYIVERLRKQINVQWKLILEWIDKLNPSELSAEENRYTNKENKVVSSASALEKYYAQKTKALEKLGRHNECIQVCNEALQKLNQFHHDNDIWFRRRIASAKGSIGLLDESIADLEKLILRKPDWFFHHEIAQMLYQKGDAKAALVSAATAALASGPLQFKSELFKFLAQLMEEHQEAELAQQHLLLVSLIREEQGWKDDPDLEANMQRLNVDTEEDHNTKKILKTLRPVWEEAQFANKVQIIGQVKKFLDHGGAGFILDETGASHYFDMRDVKGDPKKIVQGARVKFYVTESFDKSKKKTSTKAINISLAQDR